MPLISPAVSIIVPCFNSAQFIDRTLAGLIPEISQYDDVELILVDNNSLDNTLELLQQAAADYQQQFGSAAIKVLQATAAQGVNVARNFGARHASGSLLLFTDHDDAVCVGWLAAFRNAFSQGARIAAGPYSEYTSDGSLIQEVTTPELHHWDIPYGLGSNSGITRSGFERINGFQEDWHGGGDDADFFWRAHFAGMELVFVPEARIAHHMRDEEKATFSQFVGYGRSAVRLYVKFKALGMPRSSISRAIAAWPLALLELAASNIRSDRLSHNKNLVNRRRAISRLGVRSGRLLESFRQRTIYL